MGHQVRTSSSAEEGLQHFTSFQPKLVILDLCLPGMDGVEALKKLKEQVPKCPVVVISACWRTETLCSAKLHGAKDLLTKPFTLPDVRDVIARNLASQLMDTTQLLNGYSQINR